MLSLEVNERDLVYRLRKRAEIRRQIPLRKSVQEGKADRMSDLLDEAANEIETLRQKLIRAESDLGWYRKINDREWPRD